SARSDESARAVRRSGGAAAAMGSASRYCRRFVPPRRACYQRQALRCSSPIARLRTEEDFALNALRGSIFTLPSLSPVKTTSCAIAFPVPLLRIRCVHRSREWAANVRYGSKADIGEGATDVRFTPKSGHRRRFDDFG